MDRLAGILKWCKTKRDRPPAYSDKVMASNRAGQKRYALRNPDKVEARKVRFRKEVEPCEVCGSKTRVQRHHHNYSKPDDIIFLCSEHHREIHSYDPVK